MAIIFSGNQVAVEKERELKKAVRKLIKDGITPKLASLMVGHDPSSRKYLSLKQKAAKRIGAELDILQFTTSGAAKLLIDKLNKDKGVHGIMMQLPLPSNFSIRDRNEIIGVIKKLKDIDGMREDSMYVAPVVKSVIRVLGDACQYIIYTKEAKVVVVGAKGYVGEKIMKVLKDMNYKVKGVDVDTQDFSSVIKSADILISATGFPGLINKDMIKKDSVVIDVGSPEGDVVTQEVMKKAKYISPVPGGVGPLTITYLLENLVIAASK